MSRVCVGAMVKEASRRPTRLILGKRATDRAFWPGVWDLPGGHLDSGEDSEQALIRELQEEIGVTPTRWRRVDELRGPVSNGRDEGEEFMVLILYEVTAWLGTPRNLQPEEHESIAWFTVDEACGLELAHPSYPEALKRWL